VQKEQIIFLIVLFVAIVVGNMAIFLSIVTSKTAKGSRMKYFIMHLAIAGSYTSDPCFGGVNVKLHYLVYRKISRR